MLAGSSRKKSVFVELDDCQAFFINFNLKLFQCFLPECFLILLSVLSSVYTRILNVGLDCFNQCICHEHVINTGGSIFPVLLRVCSVLSVAVTTITSFVVGLHINEAIPHVLTEFG